MATLLVVLHELGVDAVELGAVGDVGQRIARGLHVQRLHALFQIDLRRRVVQQQGRAVHHSVLADHRHRVHIHAQSFACCGR